MKLRRVWQDSRVLLAESIESPLDVESNDWTISGAPGVINSPFGKTLSFAGATPDYLTKGNTSGYTVYNATEGYLTVMAWVYPTTIPGATSVGVMARDGVTSGWTFYISKTDHQAYLTLKGIGLNAVNFFNTDEVILNKWTHVACVFYCVAGDASSCLGTMYTNGSSTNTDILRSIDPAVSNTDILVGARAAGDSPFYGGIAHPMIFNGELSAQEIENYATGSAF